ncbi:hypothetical protein [Kitasatospora sp. DSM 101779]|uniref:hypothetical protein n=1 Tax=Kitasatospora sp. DSM 101779 TaxID=2853165 RepID=UPI0021D85150|nr:hypothetical protein [Kitasatospora sp. DSM 101779]MCU7821153.1 hypothetical protein [Kitasatospora sp. DSM 101779]
MRKGKILVKASFRPLLGAGRRQAPMPADAELLEFLSWFAAGRTRQAVHLATGAQGFHFCWRGTAGPCR